MIEVGLMVMAAVLLPNAVKANAADAIAVSAATRFIAGTAQKCGGMVMDKATEAVAHAAPSNNRSLLSATVGLGVVLLPLVISAMCPPVEAAPPAAPAAAKAPAASPLLSQPGSSPKPAPGPAQALKVPAATAAQTKASPPPAKAAPAPAPNAPAAAAAAATTQTSPSPQSRRRSSARSPPNRQPSRLVRAFSRKSPSTRRSSGASPNSAGAAIAAGDAALNRATSSAGTSGSSTSSRMEAPTSEDLLAEELWTVANMAMPIPIERLNAYPNLKKFNEKEKYSGPFGAEKTAPYLQTVLKRLSGKVNDQNEVRIQWLAAAIKTPGHFRNGYIRNEALSPLLSRVAAYREDTTKFAKSIVTLVNTVYQPEGSLLRMLGDTLIALKRSQRQDQLLKLVLCMAENPSDPAVLSARQKLGIANCEDEDSIAMEIWRTTVPGTPIGFLSAGPEAQRFCARFNIVDAYKLITLLYQRPISDGSRARIAYLHALHASQVLATPLPNLMMIKLVTYNSLVSADHKQLDWVFHNFDAVNGSAQAPPPPQLWRFLAESMTLLQLAVTGDAYALMQRRAQLICVCAATTKMDDNDVSVLNSVVRSLDAKSCEVFDTMVSNLWQEHFGQAQPAERLNEVTEGVDLVPVVAGERSRFHQMVLGALSDRPINDESRFRIVFMLLALRFSEHFKVSDPSGTNKFLASVYKELAAYRKRNARNVDAEAAPARRSANGGVPAAAATGGARRRLSERIRTLLSDRTASADVARDARQYVVELENLIGGYSPTNAHEWDAFEAVVRSAEARRPNSFRLRLGRRIKKLGSSIEASAYEP